MPFYRAIPQKTHFFPELTPEASSSIVRFDCKWQAVHRNKAFISLSSLINCCCCRWQCSDNNRDSFNTWLKDVGVYDIQKYLNRTDRWRHVQRQFIPGTVYKYHAVADWDIEESLLALRSWLRHSKARSFSLNKVSLSPSVNHSTVSACCSLYSKMTNRE